uniref:Uncharacterized protein n=1 Tax=Anguilla anguilla TaxID=7936 RepID=A0A0E9Q7C0_ANGAN
MTLRRSMCGLRQISWTATSMIRR